MQTEFTHSPDLANQRLEALLEAVLGENPDVEQLICGDTFSSETETLQELSDEDWRLMNKLKSISLSIILPKESSVINAKALEECLPPPHTNIFGLESWRYAVWEHDIIKELACPMLFSLRTTNIYVFDEDLDTIRAELETIQAHYWKIAVETGLGEPNRGAIRFRVENALAMLDIVDSERSSVGIAIE
jgi:hypothetical protein